MNLVVKTFVAIALMTLASAKSEACSPPLPLAQQRFQLNTVLNSEAFTKALAPMIDKDVMVKIANVTFDHGVVVHLSNQCDIQLCINYLPPDSNGMCPTVKDVTANTTCSNQAAK